MYQPGAGVAHIKEQYLIKQDEPSSSSSSSSSSTTDTTNPTDTTAAAAAVVVAAFSTTINTAGHTEHGSGVIRARTKEQLGLVDNTPSMLSKSGKDMSDVVNVLPKDLMLQLRKHRYPFIAGTEIKRKERKGHKSKNGAKKRSGPPTHCYKFLKTGACDWGDTCRFKHLNAEQLKELDERTATELKAKEKEAEAAAAATTTSTTPTTTTTTATTASSSSSSSSSSSTTTTTTTTTTDSAANPAADPAALKPPPRAGATETIFRTRKTIDFHHKVYVGPLTTLGNLPYRRVMKDYGTDITCGEMAIDQNVLKASPSEWALLRRHKCEDVFGIQIAGGDHRMMDRLAQVIENEISCDFVDLNMGCPLDFICNKGMGSRLMNRVSRVKDIVTNMTSRLSVPMTLKLRVGWTNDSPMADSLLRKIPLWNVELSQGRQGGLGIQAVTIHGRSRLQRYKNLANWDFIRSCAQEQVKSHADIFTATGTGTGTTGTGTKTTSILLSSMESSMEQESDVPKKAAVIGNGDVYSFTDWNRELASGELTTCMLARGALIKPWLPTEIKEQRHWDISANERMEILRAFVKYGLQYWGSDESGVSRCRRFFLEWMSFLHRYIPVGLLERVPHRMNERPPRYVGRNDLETLMASTDGRDWVKLSTLAGLPPPKSGYKFTPKHRANAYAAEEDRQQQVASVSVVQTFDNAKKMEASAAGGQVQNEAEPVMKKQRTE